MLRTLALLVLLLSVSFVFAGFAQAGPVLDDLLNYPVIDQKCPADTVKEEGMGLVSQGKAKFIALSKEKPLGQTFRLGSKADKLWRITVGICHWPDSWQEGEEVTFTLWDSPKKSGKLYSRTLDFAHKWFKWDVVFDIHLPTKPETEYYFELTHNGSGDNKINVAYIPGNVYTRGQPYVAGEPQSDFDLHFVALIKPKGNRESNLRRFLSRFDLSYPPLAEARWAYYRGDVATACKLILKEFETRTQPDSLVPTPVPAGKLDTTRVDMVCDEGRLYHKDDRNEWIEMSDRTTWREVWPNTADYVRQNDLFSDLGRAYQSTGNEKYARKLNELMLDYIQDNTSPFEGGMRGGRWVAMFQAWRLGDAWGGFGAACKSKGLTDDVKLGWIDYWCRMAKFAELEPSGGNHANAVGQALMQFGYRFPEYRESKHWRQWGFNKLVENSLDLFHEDGACKEPTMNYHGYSLSNLLSGLEMARKYGVEIPEVIMKRTGKALAYTAYMLKPDGQAPSNGDTNCEEFSLNARLWDGWRKGEAMKGYRMFGRKDLLYIATAGKEGTRPESDSYYFPDMRYFVMRSDWGGENGKDFDQARYLLLRGGRYGSHGHSDLNQITLYAYGRPLIIDPGRTTYGTPLMRELSSNRSHNVLLVDDLRMNHVDPTLHTWYAGPVMSFVDNSYTNLYDGVDHRRAVIFVRPDYYVMFDHAEGNEQHKIGINFWLTPPGITIDRASAAVHTNEPDGSNVLIKVIGPTQVELEERKGTLDLHGERSDIPVVTFWQTASTQADFATLMYPYPRGAGVPEVRTIRHASGDGQACAIETSSGVDYIFYSLRPGKAEIPDAAAFEGRAGLIRTDGGKQVVSFALVQGSAVYLGRQALATSANPVEELSVRCLPDKLDLTCKTPEPTLEIAALGRTRAFVNGKQMTISGETFRPFR